MKCCKGGVSKRGGHLGIYMFNSNEVILYPVSFYAHISEELSSYMQISDNLLLQSAHFCQFVSLLLIITF